LGFKVINSNGNSVMSCRDTGCIPDEAQLTDMAKAGYKFMLDGKIVTIKKIRDFICDSSADY